MRLSLKERHAIPLWWTFTLATISLILFLVCVALVETDSFAHRQENEEDLMIDINVCLDLNDNNDVACNDGEDEEGPLPDVLNPVPDDNNDQNALVTIQKDRVEDNILYKGVALAGGEIKGVNLVPDDNDAHLFDLIGMNTFRIPILWENFALIGGEIQENGDYVKDLDTLILSLIERKASIVLVLYNGMRYAGTRNLPGPADIKNLWKNIVARYPFGRMVYSLMNEEPENGSDVAILAYNAVALDAIREAEEENNLRTHLVLISGTDGNRLLNWQGSQNARRLDTFEDSGRRYANVVHMYFDNDMTGKYEKNECMSTDLFKQRFSQDYPFFRDWMIKNNQTIFIAEFGAPDTPTCRANVAFFLDEVRKTVYSKNTTRYGFIGWTLWAAGKRWNGTVPFALSPGCKANTLLWNNALYNNYLPQLDEDPRLEFDEIKRRAIKITNKIPVPFIYLDGYVPYQFVGSAPILFPNNNVVYLYSNNNINTPSLSLRIRYTTFNNHVLTFGLFYDPSSSTKVRVATSIQTRDNRPPIFKIVADEDCEIRPIGPNAIQTEIRCYLIKYA